VRFDGTREIEGIHTIWDENSCKLSDAVTQLMVAVVRDMDFLRLLICPIATWFRPSGCTLFVEFLDVGVGVAFSSTGLLNLINFQSSP
jgi:hypothetical protein